MRGIGFGKRFYRDSRRAGQKIIATDLQQSFARAKKVCLKGAHATLRTINNQFVPADYFFDKLKGCRFVVIRYKGRLKLSTVERPYL